MIFPPQLLIVLHERKQAITAQLDSAAPAFQPDDAALRLYRRLLEVRLDEIETLSKIIKMMMA